MELTKLGKMMVAGHRGDCYNCYENTLPAFQAAIDAGADMIETDVRLTKDGYLILMHDDKVDRTTDGTGLIAEKTFTEMRSLNAGSRYAPLQVPTLEELLQLLEGTGVTLNLEIKEYNQDGNQARCDECIEKCVELIEKYNFGDKMVFNSFDAYVLQYIADRYPGKYLLHGFYPYSIMRNVDKNPDDYLYCACIFDDRNQAHYDYLISKGIEPWIGAGVTKALHLKECFDMGARLVTTNFPADCLKKLTEMGAR